MKNLDDDDGGGGFDSREFKVRYFSLVHKYNIKGD